LFTLFKILFPLSISELLVFRSFKISFVYAVYVSDFASATPLKPSVYAFVPLDNSTP
jgi:hypothetical protein